MKNLIKSAHRQYWAWVTGPDYYWDENGRENPVLNPSITMDRSKEWWSCDRRTRRGDLVLLYRTAPMKDLAYVLQAQTNADTNDEALANGWSHICYFEPLIKFSSPVSLASLREDDVLREWCGVRMKFRRRVVPIQSNEWKQLMHLAGRLNPEIQRQLQGVSGD